MYFLEWQIHLPPRFCLQHSFELLANTFDQGEWQRLGNCIGFIKVGVFQVKKLPPRVNGLNLDPGASARSAVGLDFSNDTDN